MRKLLIFTTMALILSACTSPTQLTVVHVNDTHSHFDPLRSGEAGVIERAAFLDSVRAADGPENVLTLHAGDFSQGTSYFSVLKGDLEIATINAMGYDCIVLGNHEFDNGIEELTRRLSSLKTPVVCANYDFSSFELSKYVKPYAIVEKAGKKIGIIGLLTDITTMIEKTIADRIPALDTVEELNRWADYLKNEEKCDMIIALTHIGFDGAEMTDMAIIPKSRHIDMVVGGHSHTALEEMAVAIDMDGREVPVVTAECWGYYMGIAKVRF